MALLRFFLALAALEIASSFTSSPLYISNLGKKRSLDCLHDQWYKAGRHKSVGLVQQLHSSDGNSKSKAYVSQKLTTSLGLKIKENSRKNQILQSYGARPKSTSLAGVIDSFMSYMKGFLKDLYNRVASFYHTMIVKFSGKPKKARKETVSMETPVFEVEDVATEPSSEVLPPPDNTRVLQLIGGYAKRHSNETLADSMKTKSDLVQPKMSKYAGIGTTAWGKDVKDSRIRTGEKGEDLKQQVKPQGDEEDEDSKTRRLEKLMSAYASRSEMFFPGSLFPHPHSAGMVATRKSQSENAGPPT